MRWGKYAKPEYGAIRLRDGFLFLPKRLNGEWRWLEWAQWHEMYFRPEGNGGRLVWHAFDWVPKV